MKHFPNPALSHGEIGPIEIMKEFLRPLDAIPPHRAKVFYGGPATGAVIAKLLGYRTPTSQSRLA
jgi:hypothetical protein